VVDGLNVARAISFAGGVPSLPSGSAPHEAVTPIGYAEALAMAIDHFHAHGFDVHAILPVWALDGGRRSLLGGERLLPYVQAGTLHLSPTGTNDDDFILELARCRDAYVLTNDLFRDHIAQGRVTKQWVASRRISYMYVHKQILAVMPSPPTEASQAPWAQDGMKCSPRKAICKRRLPRHANRPASIRPRNAAVAA